MVTYVKNCPRNIIVLFKERIEKLFSIVDGKVITVTNSDEGSYVSISIRPMESKLFCIE